MLRTAGLAAIVALGTLGAGAAARAETPGAWADIVPMVFGDRPMQASGVVEIEAPYRAEDAALVPISVSFALPEGDPRRVERVTLVIDENPAPVAAAFEIGEGAGVSRIDGRYRVESYTPIHAVAELSDGSLHVAEDYVKASGGCAAPMGKDPEEALANLGRMKLRQGPADAPGRAEAQVMIRHPNNSGLQMDQLTRHYIPAHFIHTLTVAQGETPILRMEGGISLSEDPNLRFDFRPTGEPIRVRAEDTEGGAFEGEWPFEAAPPA